MAEIYQLPPRLHCRTCVFYHTKKQGAVSGECRRFPPQIVRVADGMATEKEFAWPEVTPAMWCGEHGSIHDDDEDEGEH